MGVYHITYAPGPREVYLYFEAECNLSCWGCIAKFHPIDCHLMGEEPPALGSLSPEEVLSFLKPYSFKRIFFMGSEPTVDPFFVPLAFRLKEEFFSYNILLTNGYKLVRTEALDEICVSIKAVTEALFREFTGASDSRRVLSNFRRYYEDARVKLRAESILIPGYIDWQEIEKIASFIGGVDTKIPYRIDAYYPFLKNDRFRRPTIEEMKRAKGVAEQFLDDVSILHHGIDLKYEVRRIY